MRKRASVFWEIMIKIQFFSEKKIQLAFKNIRNMFFLFDSQLANKGA